MKYCYILTEGPHDVEFIGRLLKLSSLGAQRETYKERVDSFWYGLIPTKFPPDEKQDLAKRVVVPIFFQSEEVSIAIHSTAERGKFFNAFFAATMAISGFEKAIHAFAILADTDYSTNAQERYKSIVNQFQGRIPFPDAPGEVHHGGLKTGIFLFPNNEAQGTLEDILVQCCDHEYEELLQCADAFVTKTNFNVLTKQDVKEINKPAGLTKATLGALTSIIKPGKSIQMAIQDAHIVTEKTTTQGDASQALRFINELLP